MNDDHNYDQMTEPTSSATEVRKAIATLERCYDFGDPVETEELDNAWRVLKEVRDNSNWVIYVP
jgi:hypothetical protein